VEQICRIANRNLIDIISGDGIGLVLVAAEQIYHQSAMADGWYVGCWGCGPTSVLSLSDL
jgi:hypothetical protein